MTRLHTELHRLYLPADTRIDALLGAPTAAPGADLAPLLCPQGHTRAMVLGLARPAHWDSLLRVWQGVQADVGMPAPAIAVNGTDGYQLWFSLLEPVPTALAAAFLCALQAHYLADTAPRRLSMWPVADGGQPSGQGLNEVAAITHLRVPAQLGEDRWSAFVTPDLARIFSEDPWLDLPPSDASQADVLAGLSCTRPDVFESACQRWRQPQTPAHPQALPQSAPTAPAHPLATPFTTPFATPAQAAATPMEPGAFLRQVMNDPTAPLALRVEAAKALLPHVR